MLDSLIHLEVPGPRSRSAFDAEERYLAPGTQSVALFSRLCLDHGEGALLYDLDGNRYIDLLAGVGVASLGYNHPRYVAAMQRQLGRVVDDDLLAVGLRHLVLDAPWPARCRLLPAAPAGREGQCS